MNICCQPLGLDEEPGDTGEPPSRTSSASDDTDEHPPHRRGVSTPGPARHRSHRAATDSLDAAAAPPICLDDPTDGLTTDEAAALVRLSGALIAEALRGAGSDASAEHDMRVRLVRDDAMSAAHLEHLGVAGTTDVITFDGTGGATASDGAPLDVDVLVCVDEAERQAASRGHTRVRELGLYVLHAALHCLGYDDADDDSFATMHAEEDRVFRAIGLPPVFAAGHDPANRTAASATGGDA